MRWASCVLAVGIVFSGMWAVRAAGAEPAKDGGRESAALSAADQLVQEALSAELKGDNVRRDELLAQALKNDPNCRAARWQSGYVKIEGKWLSVVEAAKKLAADPNLAEYRRRRDEAANAGLFTRGSSDTLGGGTSVGATAARGSSAEIHRTGVLSPAGLAAEAALARWCRTKQLSDEERAHWTQVLLDDSSNTEAEARLGIKVFMGRLMTFAEIDAAKKQHAEEEKQLSDWKTTVSRWRKMLDAGSETERDQAAEEMARHTNPAVIPALEWAVLSDSPKRSAPGSSGRGSEAATRFQREAIALLGRLPDQRATYSLAGYSVLAPRADLRKQAAAQLKSRPLHDWVPLLISGLANPIQFDYAIAIDPGIGVAVYHAVASQESADAVHRVEYTSSSSGSRPGMNGTRDVSDHQTNSVDFTGKNPTTTQNVHYDIANVHITPGPQEWTQIPGAMALARQSRNLVASIGNQNNRIQQMNERINDVLEQVAASPAKANPEVASKSATAEKAAATTDPADDANGDESEVIPGQPAADPPTTSPSIANSWWNWWADYNESHSPSKPVITDSYSDSYDLRNRDQVATSYTRTSQTNVYNRPPPPPVWHRDIPGTNIHCFAAGTLVATAAGPMAIERLQIGDRVLSQDPTTGELAFKPVLSTTKNAPVKLLRVSTAHGDVRLTLGHSFWIEGKGWRMAKELAVGDKIHGLDGAIAVTGVEKQADDPVYNLTVADFGTFFVGDAQLLVHDNTVRLPTRMVLPGYAVARK